MKIGDFAKKYDMNITTVRYYVDKALLTPERKNNQYIFNKSCMDDMEKILKYKSFNFSLEEIGLLFFLEKTSHFRDETVLDVFSELLNQKLSDLEAEEQKLRQTIENLKAEIENFSATEHENEESKYGFPITFIPHLYCPSCHTPLNLEAADITAGKIINGNLTCPCGYSCRVENGVILCDGYTESTPFKAFENIESVAAITDEFGSKYRMLIEKTYMWMYHNLSFDGNHKNLMVGPFAFNFLLKHCHNFSKDTTFVIVDPSLKRISKLQEYMKEFDLQTVYLAGDVENMPLNSGCVDVYIDDFSSTNHIFTYNTTPFDKIAPLIRKRGEILGIFANYGEAPNSIKEFKKDHPDFIPGKMTFSHIKSSLTDNGLTFAESKLIGRTSGREKEFIRQLGNESISVMGYKAVKK